MTLLDRILGREPSVAIPATPKPHNFCSHCGEPMVDGYMVIGREFDRETGQPVKRVSRRRLCLTLHRKDMPEPDELGGFDGRLAAHDGFKVWVWWSAGGGDLMPDCDPRADGAA